MSRWPAQGLAALVLACAGAATAAPVVNELTPLVVIAPPKDAPPSDVTIAVGADQEFSGMQAVSIWPKGALATRANGWVTLNCQVDAHGLAETCRVIFESPAGRGFGGAALALRPTFKLKPRMGPDGPVAAAMNIAVAFRAPETESNLNQIQAATMQVAPSDSSPVFNVGSHEVNASNLVIYHNPVATRSITMLSEPAWAQAPSFDELAAAYPPEGAGVEGYVVAHCQVQKTGLLKGCVAVKELPMRHGFAHAALSLMSRFQASPESLAAAPKGAPIEVDVPIRFPPAGEARDRTVRAPIWLAGADPQSLLREAPLPALRPNSPGAVVQCRVGEGGGLEACAIELTSPDGIDYDEAAVKFASRLKMNLWSADAGPVVGGVAHVPVRPGMAADEQARKSSSKQE